MKPVIVSPEAEAQIRAIDDWWRESRTASPLLFLDEFAEGLEMIRHFAGAGQQVPHPTVGRVRRILLRAVRYHVYYVEGESEVRVVAVWSAVRRRGPDLRGL
ncbi:MAG: type II toxin-antitoxin system RelE/ParE family toxin [Polyangiales bacterium]